MDFSAGRQDWTCITSCRARTHFPAPGPTRRQQFGSSRCVLRSDRPRWGGLKQARYSACLRVSIRPERATSGTNWRHTPSPNSPLAAVKRWRSAIMPAPRTARTGRPCPACPLGAPLGCFLVPPDPPRVGPTILVVDDHRDGAESMANILRPVRERGPHRGRLVRRATRLPRCADRRPSCRARTGCVHLDAPA